MHTQARGHFLGLLLFQLSPVNNITTTFSFSADGLTSHCFYTITQRALAHYLSLTWTCRPLSVKWYVNSDILQDTGQLHNHVWHMDQFQPLCGCWIVAWNSAALCAFLSLPPSHCVWLYWVGWTQGFFVYLCSDSVPLSTVSYAVCWRSSRPQRQTALIWDSWTQMPSD